MKLDAVGVVHLSRQQRSLWSRLSRQQRQLVNEPKLLALHVGVHTLNHHFQDVRLTLKALVAVLVPGPLNDLWAQHCPVSHAGLPALGSAIAESLRQIMAFGN